MRKLLSLLLDLVVLQKNLNPQNVDDLAERQS